MTRGRAVTGLVIAVLTGAAGCGVPTDRTPRPIAHDAVPFDLLGPAATTTTAPGTQTKAEVFFIRAGRLTAVARSITAPVTVARLLDALLQGPTTAEGDSGVETATGGQIEIRGVSVRSGVAEINLSSTFASLEGTSQVEAIAQLVYTGTAAPGVAAARFLVEGEAVAVPRGDGTLTSAPLQRNDFSVLTPP
jgi:spore germination protein GerM